MAWMRVDLQEEVWTAIMDRLKTGGPAWSWELTADLHLAPSIVGEAVNSMRGAGLIFRPERVLEDGVITFDRWQPVPGAWSRYLETIGAPQPASMTEESP